MEKLKVTDNCNCLEKLMIIGRVRSFENKDVLSSYAKEVEEGQLCVVFNNISENGDFDEDGNYISFFNTSEELYPIEYCPMCGKRIKYERVKTLIQKVNI